MLLFFDIRNYGVPSTSNDRKVVMDKPRKGDKVLYFPIKCNAIRNDANERDGLTIIA